MIGKPPPTAPEPIVSIDVSDIHKGGLGALKEETRRLVDAIEPQEPQLITYGFHLDEEAGEMTVSAVHPVRATLELHREIGRDGSRKLGDLITLRQIHGLVVSERFAGFDQSRHASDRR
jgi:hypothetical protein